MKWRKRKKLSESSKVSLNYTRSLNIRIRIITEIEPDWSVLCQFFVAEMLKIDVGYLIMATSIITPSESCLVMEVSPRMEIAVFDICQVIFFYRKIKISFKLV